ncbi:unnamed protein product [Lampetra fluviatilis]
MALAVRSVLISEPVDPSCARILRGGGLHVDERLGMSPAELVECIKDYDALIVRSATKVTAEVLHAGERLLLVGRAGTGVDNVDVEAATRRGVIVMNTPGGNTMSAAELTCGMLLCLARFIPQAMASMHEGKWERKKFMGTELLGKTLGIVGLGRIGREVALRMQAFGMTTIGYDPIIPAEVSAAFGVEQLSLEQLWPKCDFITVHTPLMPSTTGLLNDASFARCKRGVRVVNCARGGIIDEDALQRALESGQCGGAGLDVFIQEPPTNVALIRHPRVVCGPHLGASTHEAQSRCGEELAQQVVELVQGKALVGAVNAGSLGSSLAPETRPWVKVAESLGAVARAVLAQGVRGASVRVAMHGDAGPAVAVLAPAVLTALLRVDGENHLNLVNAAIFAKEAGVTVSTAHEASPPQGLEPSSSTPCLSVELQGGAGAGGPAVVLVGTARGDQPLLLAVNGASFLPAGATLAGTALLYRTAPGAHALPAVAGVLAAQGVEVRSFCVSAVGEDGAQWGLLGLSSPTATLDGLAAHVKKAVQIQF